MDKKYGILIICAAILFLCCVGTSSARIWYVDDGGGADFTRIQDAITAASTGDTIIVKDGNYIENVNVNKSLTIQSENGSDLTIVQAANSSDHVFEVTVNYVNISGFTVKGATGGYNAGIYLGNGVDHCNISNDNASSNCYGIYLYYSSNNTIKNNNASNNGCGIRLYSSSYNTIRNNNISNNDYGISLRWYSSNNTIKNNNAANNSYGISFDSSSYNTLTSNIFVNDGLSVFNSYQNTVEDNTVNGKPLVYLEDTLDIVVIDAGQIILVKCRNITVENLNLSNTSVGIELWETENSRISNNTVCHNNWEGIYLGYSNNNSIVNNNCSSNYWLGIYLRYSSNNSIANNNCSNNDDGIYLSVSNNNSIMNNNCSSNHWEGIYLGSSNSNGISSNNCSSNDRCGIYLDYSNNNNSITNNNCSNNEYGIYLDYSSNNCIMDNNCSNNGYGILLRYSNNNRLTGNTMLGNGILIGGESLGDYIHEIDESNTINGKPVYYWKDVNGGRIPDDAGQAILVNCKDVVVENQNLNEGSVGVEVAFSSYITIKNNNCSNNIYGFLLLYSNNNSIANNNCSSNGYSILFEYSNNNKIYPNNFINNTDNVCSRDSTNIWNSTEKITYTYNGSTYTNYLGNYWDDYKEKYPDAEEIDECGIWNMPYSIDGDKDNYPLMMCFENYITPTPANVVIWYAHYDAAGNDHYNLNDEYIVLKNIGGTSINLEGWVMQDKENHTYIFPCFELLSGATVTIRTGSGTNTATDLYWGSKRAIWNNKGDTVYLYDPNNNLVATKSW